MDEDCVSGAAAAAAIVYWDDVVVAFRDIPPVIPGQRLVVPRTHLPALADTFFAVVGAWRDPVHVLRVPE